MRTNEVTLVEITVTHNLVLMNVNSFMSFCFDLNKMIYLISVTLVLTIHLMFIVNLNVSFFFGKDLEYIDMISVFDLSGNATVFQKS